MPTDYDSPWKEALDVYFEPFLTLLFPEVHAQIDWTHGYESLDKEFQQVVRDAEPEPTHPIGRQAHPPAPVVFATGADAGNQDIAASGEADLACRICHRPKALFA